jgi:CHAT domain-containing protein
VLPELRAVRNRPAEAKVLTRWARIDLDHGDTGAALVKLDEAVAVAHLVGNPQVLQRALFTRAQALQQAGRAGDAIASIESAIASVEALRGNIQRSEMRTSYLATVRSYFDLYIDLLQRQGNAAAAFAISERARARTLLEGLAESATKIEKGVDAGLLARLRRAQAAINAKDSYRSQLQAADGDPARVAAATREIARLVDDWNDLRAKIRAASPAYWALQAPEPVTVERVQASLLDANSTLVEFYLGDSRSYAWVIDRQAIRFVELPAASAIEPVARKYHALLSRETETLPAAERDRLAAGVAAEGRRLAALIWQPIESRVRGKRLVIAADGVLQYVPFAALPSTTGAPLITRHEIVYVPSASVLDTIRKDSRPLSPGALTAVFADPVFSTGDARFGVDEDQQPASRAPSPAASWQRLRFSRMEADAIRAVAPGSFQALDFTAAKQTLTQRDLRNYRILHFATHGSLDTEQPELSGLVLSLVDRAGKPVDGYLRLHEIYNLDLDADLVVLSACRTALGKDVHGEGLIGLTRGFMYAGASRVVSSVWNVDDRASARLMERFYAAMLSKGLSPAAALREAQLSLLNEPRWSHPHYWAAFGLQGEWR